MFGKIDFLNYVILFISVFASITDLIWRKIFNWFTVPAAVAGVAAAVYFQGWSGLLQAVLGLLAGFALYGWMFWFRYIGGGDVKLLMVFGAWGGVAYVCQVAFLGVLIGGAFSLVILIVRGQFWVFAKRMYEFIQSILISELEVQSLHINKSLTFPFGISIALAAVWTAFHPQRAPLESLGIKLWN